MTVFRLSHADQSARQAIIATYIEAYNALDIVGVIRNLSENVVFQNVSQREYDANVYW